MFRVKAKRLVGRSLPLFFHRHRAAIAEALRQVRSSELPQTVNGLTFYPLEAAGRPASVTLRLVDLEIIEWQLLIGEPPATCDRPRRETRVDRDTDDASAGGGTG